MTIFTAREVRDACHKYAYEGTGDDLIYILHAYADRLEADEKAVPVYQMRNGNAWFDIPYQQFDRINSDPTRVLYTHPSPADAERLAEALRVIRQHVAKDPSALACSIIATCDAALSTKATNSTTASRARGDATMLERPLKS